MRREESRVPARYIIFNIFDDDHYRNLHGWQRPRFRGNRKSTNPPVPHVKVDLDKGTFIECANPCPTPESLYRLCDLDSAFALFGDDDGVIRFARRRVLRAQGAANVPRVDFDDAECTRRALFATTRIVDLIERFAAQGNHKVLYVLSYAAPRVQRFVKEGRRFDATFVDFLEKRRLPYVDLLKAHAADFAKSGGDLDRYLSRHFIGHYSPLGNFFCAFAMKDAVLRMLDPPSPAYSGSPTKVP